MKARHLAAILVFCSICAATVSGRADPFSEGRMRLALGGGTVRNFGDSYLTIGAGFGYFVLDGLELGLDSEIWLFGEPLVAKLSPTVRYVFHMVPVIKPYLGGFYRHWFIGSEHDDIDTLGGRVGLFLVTGANLAIGGGVAHEITVSACEDECSTTYPEFHFSLAF